eukprot:6203391-Pleurochrysis_carterae.AAC.2
MLPLPRSWSNALSASPDSCMHCRTYKFSLPRTRQMQCRCSCSASGPCTSRAGLWQKSYTG